MIEKVRGAARLTQIEALPVTDPGTRMLYAGSISKIGDNADWDWGMYQDENGEWVLMEADGAGCIFNFTQHRYPTSEVPVFRFYFDHSPTPQFSIIPAEFGKKAPFLRPLADIFEGPDPQHIYVVRSFVPMNFRTHCKVTSSVYLTGNDCAKGEGGWGHVLYHQYPSAEGIRTFSTEDPVPLPALLIPESSDSCRGTVPAGESTVLFEGNGPDTLCGIGLTAENFTKEQMRDLWISLTFDGRETVLAPFGTFFGCEYAETPAKIETALLLSDFSGPDARFFNGYPMPFFENFRVKLINRGDKPCSYFAVLNKKTSLTYDKATTGLFTATPYLARQNNVMGKNTLIGELSGCGQMAYAVLSGYDIACGCEGDVRVFLDGLRSPSVESDGSESWASYGWGFCSPPQCNLFSGYNSAGDPTWSELRLTFTDAYAFTNGLRFELEHGCQNDGGGCHSGQVFAYVQPRAAVRTVTEFACTGHPEPIRDRFENGIHENYQSFVCYRQAAKTTFTLFLPEGAENVILHRVFLQEYGPMAADVWVDDVRLPACWLYPDKNPYYRLREDAYTLPEACFRGKKKITVTLTARDENWNLCEISALVR